MKITYWEIMLPRILEDTNNCCPECGALDEGVDYSHALQVVPNTHLRHTSQASALQEAKRIALHWPAERLEQGRARFEYMPWHDPKKVPQRVNLPGVSTRYYEKERLVTVVTVSTEVDCTSVTVSVPMEWRCASVQPVKMEIIGPDGLTYHRTENVITETRPWALAYYKDYSNHEFVDGKEPPYTLVVGTESFRIVEKELVLYDDTQESPQEDVSENPNK